MECKDVKDLLSLLQDGELDYARSQEVEAHLKGCQDCQHEWQLLRQLEKGMKDLPMLEPGASFTAAVMVRVKEKKKRSWLSLPSMVYSLVFLLFFVLGFFLTKESPSTTEPRQEIISISQLLEESQSLALLSVQGETVNLLAGDQNSGR